MKGYVYVLSNESMPGIVKIGRSVSGGKGRAKAIYQTGVPEPFIVEFEILTDDCKRLEKTVHERMADARVSGRREFFRVSPLDAEIAIIEEHLGYRGVSIATDEEREVMDAALLKYGAHFAEGRA